MKRLIPAAVLTIILIILCVFSKVTVDRVGKKTNANIKECLESIENDKKDSEKKIKKLETEWKKNMNVMSLFVNREKLDQVSGNIQTLKKYTDSRDEFDEACAKLKVIIDDIIEEQSLSLITFF